MTDYPPGHFTVPVRAWFGNDWKPRIDWRRPQQIATRSSEDGDNFNLKGTPNKWPATKRAPR